MDSPASDLSDYASDDFPDEVKGRRISIEHPPDHEPQARPRKRPRLQTRAPSDPPTSMLPVDDLGELSEDTDGSVPASPHHPGMSAEDDFGQDQVTVCTLLYLGPRLNNTFMRQSSSKSTPSRSTTASF